MATVTKYLIESSENFDAFLIAAGMPAEQAAEMAHGTPTLEFTVTDTQLVVRTIGDESYNNNTFVFGQECESNFAGLKFLDTITKTDTGFASVMKVNGKTGSMKLEKTDYGLLETMELDGVVTKKVFKQI